MEIDFPFPVLHIQRLQSCIYHWYVTLADQLMAEEVDLTSIEGCLQQACQVLPDDTHAVEIRYRGVCMGTYQVQLILQTGNEIADRIALTYAGVMDGVVR